MTLIIGLDMGKRIGIARADLLTKIAFPDKTVSFNELVLEINKAKPLYLVVGWPLLLNGNEGLQCQRVKSMIGNLLYQSYQMEVYYEDERYSTELVKWTKDKDSASAAYILQKYLNKIS